ncbi:MAG TPA: GNAT family N-acetyltransferase [Rhodospirillaceae bacterium]|nr:MAG: hypothetical protein A2018_03330 [Alphaproteobacteria bacterium GWF2_58_20]HAU29321.1 GNAT family N-acetyltransferase [Rhodospirillaceae bacterium]
MGGIENPILLDLPVPIRTKRLTLRPCRAGDGRAIFEAVSESMQDFVPWLELAQGTPTLEESDEKARRFAADFILRKHLSFAIFASDRFLGMIGVYGFNWKIPSAHLGYWLRTSETGKGIMTEAARALTLYLFRHVGLRRLAILYDENNTKSVAVAKRLGFALESTSPMADIHPLTHEPTTELTFVRFHADGLDDTDVSWG